MQSKGQFKFTWSIFSFLTMPETAENMNIKKIMVTGSGCMDSGIAQVMAAAGDMGKEDRNHGCIGCRMTMI
jgi:hypothetical protein